MMNKNSISTFRQAGYQCSHCQTFTMVFGGNPPPEACAKCLATQSLKMIWDHLVTTETTVEDMLSGASNKPEGIDASV